MKILGIDTSTMRESVAIVEDGVILNQISSPESSLPSRELLVMIDNLLRMEFLTIEDIDAMAIAIGPGSFTGLKIGLALAKGISLPSGIPLIPVSTLDALVLSYGLEGRVAPIIDGRANIIYSAIYLSDGEGGYDCVVKEGAFNIDQLCESVKEKTIFFGDALERYGQEIERRLGDLAIIKRDVPKFTVAAGVGFIALTKQKEGIETDYKDVNPEYILKPLPERNL